MGVLTELFVASPEQANQYGSARSSGGPAPAEINVSEFGGLTSLEFEILWSLLEDSEWSPEIHTLEPASVDESGETWLFRFPTPLVSLLRDLSSDRLPAVASRWAAQEELSCEAADVIPVLSTLQLLSRHASSDGASLYLWCSL